MWEDINGLYHCVSLIRAEEDLPVGPHRFCDTIKFGSHRFHGVSDDTLPHDEGWQFLQIGRVAGARRNDRAHRGRRVSQPARTPTAGEKPDNHQWMAVLKSVAAYEIYRRQYHSRSSRSTWPRC